MASNLAHRTSAAGLSRESTRTAEAGRATDVDSLEFNCPSLDYSDLPRRFRSGAKAAASRALTSAAEPRRGELTFVDTAMPPAIVQPRDDTAMRRNEREAIASSVLQLPQPRRSGDRVVQRRVGWIATPDRIVVTTAERELQQTAAKQYKPAGDWLIENRKTYPETSGKAKKRTGEVRDDASCSEPAAGPEASADTGIEAKVAAEFPHAALALGALPSSVRQSVISRAPVPRFYQGSITQSSDGNGRPTKVTVKVLRMDAHRAAVVHAVRDHGASQWSVTMATYNLGEPQLEVA